jgi:hypothetical protein
MLQAVPWRDGATLASLCSYQVPYMTAKAHISVQQDMLHVFQPSFEQRQLFLVPGRR